LNLHYDFIANSPPEDILISKKLKKFDASVSRKTDTIQSEGKQIILRSISLDSIATQLLYLAEIIEAFVQERSDFPDDNAVQACIVSEKFCQNDFHSCDEASLARTLPAAGMFREDLDMKKEVERSMEIL
jgi:hypothetical protein